MIQLTLRTAVAVAAALLWLPSAASAVSSYMVTGGQLSTIQFVDVTGAPVPCPIGSTSNCLTAAASITSGSITLDLAGNQLIDMSYDVAGPATIDMGGVNGLTSVSFANALYQSSGTSALSPQGGGAYNFGPAPGTITADVTLNDLGGGSTLIQGASFASAPAGTIFFSGDTLNLSLQGVDLGQFCDPTNPKNCLFVKADFNLQAIAAIPEPSAALAFGLGALLVGAGARRRGGRA